MMTKGVITTCKLFSNLLHPCLALWMSTNGITNFIKNRIGAIKTIDMRTHVPLMPHASESMGLSDWKNSLNRKRFFGLDLLWRIVRLLSTSTFLCRISGLGVTKKPASKDLLRYTFDSRIWTSSSSSRLFKKIIFSANLRSCWLDDGECLICSTSFRSSLKFK